MDPNCEPVRCFRRSKWFPQGFFLNTISCLSHSPQPFQNLSSFPFFCYFTVNVVKIKRASSSSGRILFFFSKPSNQKGVILVFPIFSSLPSCLWQDKVPVLISSIFSRFASSRNVALHSGKSNFHSSFFPF